MSRGQERSQGLRTQRPHWGLQAFLGVRRGCLADSLGYVLRACLSDYICGNHSINAGSWDFLVAQG